MTHQEDIENVNRSTHRLFDKMIQSNWGECSDNLKSLTMLDLRIIRAISDNPSKQIKDILQVLGIPNSTLTSAINRLEKKGVLRRTYNYEDRRSYILELTDFGWELQTEHLQADLMLAETFLSAFVNVEDRKSFVKLFDIATSALK